MSDWRRVQPGRALTAPACHQHAKMRLRQVFESRQSAQPATGSACPEQQNLASRQTTTRHTSRALRLARRECAGCFANAATLSPKRDAHGNGFVAAVRARLNVRALLAVLALICVLLVAFAFATGSFHTSLIPAMPDMDASQPAIPQLTADNGGDTGYGVIDRDASAVFGAAQPGLACFFATVVLIILMNENGRERFIHKKRIGSSD